MKWLRRFMFRSRLFGLVLKELRQTLRNKHLLFLLLIPPTVELVILVYALHPGVDSVNIGFVDYSRTPESRELVWQLTSSGVFRARDFMTREESAVEELRRGNIGAILIVPPDFADKLS